MASVNAMRCVKIIENPSLSQRKKIEQLKHIFSRDPACLAERVPLSGGGLLRGSIGTLLHAAVYNGYTNVVRLLLNYGADVHAKDNMGQLPIIAACSHDFPGCVLTLKLLIDFGADVNVRDKYGQSLFSYSFRIRPNPKIIELLLRNGVKTRLNNLFSFLYFGNVSYAKLLIKYFLLESPNTEKPSYLEMCDASSLYWDKCQITINNELSKMKEKNLGESNISVYDILLADERMLAHYMRNEAVQEFISGNYKTLFPMHIYMIKKQIRKGRARSYLENQGHIVMNHWQPSLFHMNVRQQIFDHLEIQDLRNLRKSAILSSCKSNITRKFSQSTSPFTMTLRPRKDRFN